MPTPPPTEKPGLYPPPVDEIPVPPNVARQGTEIYIKGFIAGWQASALRYLEEEEDS